MTFTRSHAADMPAERGKGPYVVPAHSADGNMEQQVWRARICIRWYNSNATIYRISSCLSYRESSLRLSTTRFCPDSRNQGGKKYWHKYSF